MKIEKGQSLVEMALGFIILLIIVGGLVDVGRWYFVRAAMEDAVGEGANYFAAFPGDVEETLERVRGTNENTQSLLDFEAATVTLNCYTLEDKEPLDCETEAKAGDVVEVGMFYNFDLLGSLIPEISGSTTIILPSKATQIITGQ